MNIFAEWDKLPVIHLETMDRKIFHGDNVMLVRNEIHPKAVVPMHNHVHEQLLYVESGECDVTAGDEVRHVKAGGLVWFKSNEPHAVTNTLDETLVAIDIFSPIREDFM